MFIYLLIATIHHTSRRAVYSSPGSCGFSFGAGRCRDDAWHIGESRGSEAETEWKSSKSLG